MLLDKVHLNLVNIECMPTSTKFNAIIDLDVDVGDLLPYLATEIRGCTYVHGTDQLNFMDRGHIIAIRPRQITVTALQDEMRALRGELAQYRARTWSQTVAAKAEQLRNQGRSSTAPPAEPAPAEPAPAGEPA